MNITAIIGLGNPGPRFELTRHNIGFLFVDKLADMYSGSWQKGPQCEWCTIQVPIHGSRIGVREDESSSPVSTTTIKLVKPQTFMNDSGDVWSWLYKKGVRVENLLVIHDELEKKFGSTHVRQGGSARGHNGLRSLIARAGVDFWRLRIGIDRPADKKDVARYVLERFNSDELEQLDAILQSACDLILASLTL